MPNSRVLFFRGPRAASLATSALGALVVASLLVLTTLAAVQLRSRSESATKTMVRDHAYAMATHAYQAFAAANSIAEGVARTVAAKRIQDVAEFDRQFSTETEHQLLVARQSSFDGVEVVSVISASGRLINTSRTFPAPPVDVSDREGFQLARQLKGDAPHVAVPVQNRINGRWTIYLSKRLSDDRGQLLGVIFVGLSPEYFSDFYATMRPDAAFRRDATVVTLLRDDGRVMARSPEAEGLLGHPIGNVAHYRSLIDQPVQPAHQGSSRSDLPTAWDMRPDSEGNLVLAARRVDKFPFVVAVAVHEEFYLAEWRRDALVMALICGLAVAFLTGTFATLVKVVRRREHHLIEVEQLRQAAERVSQAKTSFLATVSHEVRTPLNGILGTAELLMGSELRPQQQELVRTLLASGRNLLSIIDDILDLSKIEAGELGIELAPMSARAAVHEILDLFAPEATAKGLGLSMQADEGVPALLVGDAKRVKQVVGNLVSNAIKFTDTGEVRVALTWASPDAEAGRLRIEVVDTGVGVPEEARERVFQAFGQADGSISRRFGGTGLGLAISQRLVHLMGGRIDFTSRVSSGSHFWIELPMRAASQQPSDAAADQSEWTFAHGGAVSAGREHGAKAQMNGQARVLVVEDNAINALVVEAQLRRLGHRCDIAVDGEEAIQRLSGHHYHLVLMDCMLPGISGYETARRWRGVETQTGRRRVPILALTANALASNVTQTREAGMDDFLTKPCTLDKLDIALRRWLSTLDPQSAPAADTRHPVRDSEIRG